MFNFNSPQKMMMNNSSGNNIMVMGGNNNINDQLINNWGFILTFMNKFMNGMFSDNKNDNNTYNSKGFFERGKQYRRYIVNPDNIINIKFKASSGPIVMISIDKVRPLKDLFKEYANIIGSQNIFQEKKLFSSLIQEQQMFMMKLFKFVIFSDQIYLQLLLLNKNKLLEQIIKIKLRKIYNKKISNKQNLIKFLKLI